jgi:hypothetical protein
MLEIALPACVQRVHSFDELVATPFAGSVNALCWERVLPGDFGEIVAHLDPGEGITTLDEMRLQALPLSAEGRIALGCMLEDLRRLRAHGLSPELNCIRHYPRDEEPVVVAVDVYSFHADRAPVQADTWLCTYHGAASEGVFNAEAQRRVEIPATRAELLAVFGGADDAGFREFLSDNSYDLHFAPLPPARPFSFGVGNLWRVAVEYPGSPVPPCIHRAPATLPGQAPRLLLIS